MSMMQMDTKPGSTITLDTGHVYRWDGSNWLAVYKDGTTTDIKARPVAFVMLLHYGLDELSGMAVKAFPAGGQYAPLPIEDIIRAGLNSGSQEWQALALERAAELPQVAGLEPEISALVEKGRTQAIRHGALKLRARIKRGRSG